MSGACCSKVCVLVANVMSTGVEKDGCRTRRNDSAMTAVESVGLVLQLTTPTAKVRTAKVQAARAAVSIVYTLLLLLLLARIVWNLTLAELRGLTAAVAQLVGKKVISTVQVADCHVEWVRTAHTASKGGAPIAHAKLLGVAKTGC